MRPPCVYSVDVYAEQVEYHPSLPLGHVEVALVACLWDFPPIRIRGRAGGAPGLIRCDEGKCWRFEMAPGDLPRYLPAAITVQLVAAAAPERVVATGQVPIGTGARTSLMRTHEVLSVSSGETPLVDAAGSQVAVAYLDARLKQDTSAPSAHLHSPAPTPVSHYTPTPGEVYGVSAVGHAQDMAHLHAPVSHYTPALFGASAVGHAQDPELQGGAFFAAREVADDGQQPPVRSSEREWLSTELLTRPLSAGGAFGGAAAGGRAAAGARRKKRKPAPRKPAPAARSPTSSETRRRRDDSCGVERTPTPTHTFSQTPPGTGGEAAAGSGWSSPGPPAAVEAALGRGWRDARVGDVLARQRCVLVEAARALRAAFPSDGSDRRRLRDCGGEAADLLASLAAAAGSARAAAERCRGAFGGQRPAADPFFDPNTESFDEKTASPASPAIPPPPPPREQCKSRRAGEKSLAFGVGRGWHDLAEAAAAQPSPRSPRTVVFSAQGSCPAKLRLEPPDTELSSPRRTLSGILKKTSFTRGTPAVGQQLQQQPPKAAAAEAEPGPPRRGFPVAFPPPPLLQSSSQISLLTDDPSGVSSQGSPRARPRGHISFADGLAEIPREDAATPRGRREVAHLSRVEKVSSGVISLDESIPEVSVSAAARQQPPQQPAAAETPPGAAAEWSSVQAALTALRKHVLQLYPTLRAAFAQWDVDASRRLTRREFLQGLTQLRLGAAPGGPADERAAAAVAAHLRTLDPLERKQRVGLRDVYMGDAAHVCWAAMADGSRRAFELKPAAGGDMEVARELPEWRCGRGDTTRQWFAPETGKAIFALLDENGDGFVGKEEFLAMLERETEDAAGSLSARNSLREADRAAREDARRGLEASKKSLDDQKLATLALQQGMTRGDSLSRAVLIAQVTDALQVGHGSLRGAFADLNTDGRSGDKTLSLDEFRAGLRGLELDPATTQAVFRMLDLDGSDTVDLHEFNSTLRWVGRVVEVSNDETVVERAFKRAPPPSPKASGGKLGSPVAWNSRNLKRCGQRAVVLERNAGGLIKLQFHNDGSDWAGPHKGWWPEACVRVVPGASLTAKTALQAPHP
ncbi:hypothetical protein DIPPA_33139 [Diplonema papillatum]|nr:hypothetical protein DIPPA_33139 [Diplonema papillatum]